MLEKKSSYGKKRGSSVYEGLEQRPIICLDMRSFYVSCSVIGHGLDPMEACIAVIGNQER